MQRGLERIERRMAHCEKIYYLIDFIVIAREEYKYNVPNVKFAGPPRYCQGIRNLSM